MPYGTNELLNMSRVELDALFAQSPPGPMPNGDAKGTAILDPGGAHDAKLAELAGTLWQGKTFNAATKTLQNRVTLFGVKAITADVFEGPSLMDGKPCIVIDYSKRSVVAEPVRDEIRLIAPGMYLGRIYWNGEYRGYFALQMHDMAAERARRRFNALLALVIGIPLLIAILAAMRFLPYRPVSYVNIEDQFKYGSTGGEQNFGLPYWIWKALPVVFADKLPPNRGPGWEAFGLVYENDAHGRKRDLPVGVMRGRSMGIDRVFLDCAACHATSVRIAADRPAKVYVAMPAARFDIGLFQKFLSDIALDERFNANVIVPEIERQAGRLGLVDRLIYTIAIPIMQGQLLAIRARFEGVDPTVYGPGRVDTWNAAKAGLHFVLRKLPERERFGAADFPSIWNQRKRKHRIDGQSMQLHWTGNNDSVDERNLSAAFGTGATPSNVDHYQIGRLQEWLLDAAPPPFPFPIDQAKANAGRALYYQYCASCHGKSGQDFSAPDPKHDYVGFVTPIDVVGTDRDHYDSYTYDCATVQNMNYAGTKYRFTHFRKTPGYANAPLDGIWLRAPYLHNGSVPTLRDLLNPPCPDPKVQCPDGRPWLFYRGYDVIDPVRVGYLSVASENGRQFDPFDTRTKTRGNGGHLWGTHLAPAQKDAIVEYMKTF